MREIKKTYRLELYSNRKLNIIITDNLQESANKYLKGNTIDTEFIGAFHVYKALDPLESYIFLPEDCSTSTIAHESFHATHHIMNGIGANLTDSSEESYAYLIGWIVNKCIITYLEFEKLPKPRKKRK